MSDLEKFEKFINQDWLLLPTKHGWVEPEEWKELCEYIWLKACEAMRQE